MVCNSNQYIKINKDQLYSLWLERVGFHLPSNAKSKKNHQHYFCDFTSTNGRKYSDVKVLLSSFSEQAFENVSEFFICEGCGKVYWEGSHLSRLKSFVSNYVDVKSTQEGNVYEVLSKNESQKQI
ncbi:hypothetical protein JTE90_012102 [Oedothorax gibbosus]|uniref:Mut7-C RNAse domain-containing protein n=1 Tax=Oedothorax gibbosus TaxID=931172 RepID=A0AAV6UWT8_9ARAC|nr:hypothetical protein JTE90_012102 [Oedothorax gibbosus]